MTLEVIMKAQSLSLREACEHGSLDAARLKKSLTSCASDSLNSMAFVTNLFKWEMMLVSKVHKVDFSLFKIADHEELLRVFINPLLPIDQGQHLSSD